MRNGSFFEVEPGIELYYEDHGRGDPLVFIPGWTFCTEVFEHQFSYFSNTHRVISFDPRSQGRSTLTLNGNNYQTQSSDLAKLMEHLGLEKPVLVGWSNASLATWGLIRLQGTSVLRGLVTIDLPPAPLTGNDEDWTEFSMADAADFYRSLSTSGGQRELITSYATNTMVQRELTAEELAWIVDQSTRTPPWAAAAYCAAGWFSNYLPEAKKVDANLPAMFVLAESSVTTAVPYLKQHLPNTQFELFGGHFMFWEHPEQFNRVMETFMGSLD